MQALGVRPHTGLIKPHAPAGDSFRGKRSLRIVGQFHAGIQVELGKARERELIHQFFRQLHCLRLRLVLPQERSQMISPKDQVAFGQS